MFAVFQKRHPAFSNVALFAATWIVGLLR